MEWFYYNLIILIKAAATDMRILQGVSSLGV